MNYHIIGGDQQEYGPVSTEQIRQWITEGRLNAQSQVRAEGTSDWKPLGSFPEFAALGASAPAMSPTPFGATAPLTGESDTGRQVALSAVKGPAIALMVTAGIGMAYYLFSGVTQLVTGGMGMGFGKTAPADLPPEMRQFFEMMQHMQGPLAAVISLVIVALNAFVFFGALKLLRLQKYGLAFAACIVAMVPCQCCCLLGLPFGIWGLVVMSKPYVKPYFS